MEDGLSNQPGALVVVDHLKVDLLMNIRSARNLSPFMRGEHRLGDAAKVLGVASSSLSYWVDRFLTVGLVEIVRYEQRPGKPIPVYRAVAAEFVIPFAAMPPGARSEFVHAGRRRVVDEFLRSVDRVTDRDSDAGLKISAHPNRGVVIGLVDSPMLDSSAVSEFWGVIELTADQAVELGRSIEELVSKYTAAPVAGASKTARKSFVVVMGVAPSVGVR